MQCPFLSKEGRRKVSFLMVIPLEPESQPRYFLEVIFQEKYDSSYFNDTL